MKKIILSLVLILLVGCYSVTKNPDGSWDDDRGKNYKPYNEQEAKNVLKVTDKWINKVYYKTELLATVSNFSVTSDGKYRLESNVKLSLNYFSDKSLKLFVEDATGIVTEASGGDRVKDAGRTYYEYFDVRELTFSTDEDKMILKISPSLTEDFTQRQTQITFEQAMRIKKMIENNKEVFIHVETQRREFDMIIWKKYFNDFDVMLNLLEQGKLTF